MVIDWDMNEEIKTTKIQLIIIYSIDEIAPDL